MEGDRQSTVTLAAHARRGLITTGTYPPRFRKAITIAVGTIEIATRSLSTVVSSYIFSNKYRP